MTAQTAEHLIFQGDTLRLCTEPLSHLLNTQALPTEIAPGGSLLWRGYCGTWAIEGDRLYLKRLETQNNELEFEELPFESFFPGYLDGVFAHWFTGELRCPRGECMEFVNVGFSSVYEQDLFIGVDKGIVTGERVVQNIFNPLRATKKYMQLVEHRHKLKK